MSGLTDSERADLESRRHKSGPFEVRLNPDGSIDELLMYIDGQCVMHIEQMSDNYFWMGLYANGMTLHSQFGAKNSRAKAFMNAEWWDDVRGAESVRSFGFNQGNTR